VFRNGIVEKKLSFFVKNHGADGSDGLGHGADSEEHTSELQSRRDLVCRLLLEKKKNRGQPLPLLPSILTFSETLVVIGRFADSVCWVRTVRRSARKVCDACRADTATAVICLRS